MKNYLIILLVCLIPVSAISGESVSVPWQEFKTLYKESIEQSVRKSDEKEPFHVSFRESDYTIHLKSGGGSGTAVITGNVISGKPEPVPLFSSDIIIKEISEVTGGALSCARNAGAGIVFHPSGTEPFRIRLSFFIPVQEDNRSRFLSMEIPKALKNSLNLKQPTDIIVTEVPGVNEGNGLYRFPPDEKLSVRFAKKNEVDARNTSHHEQLEKEYRAVSTPSVVLDSTSFFTSFEENGSILSVLVMDVPPEAGSHLTLAAVPGASIWSLRVNGEKMKVYENNGKEPAWIVPLSKGKQSRVELAMIRQGEKLGLHGRLETTLPGTGLSSRKAFVGIALPERVNLMSVEGPVTPDTRKPPKPPREFIGKAHYFSQSFYTGEGLRVAVSYKEPVN